MEPLVERAAEHGVTAGDHFLRSLEPERASSGKGATSSGKGNRSRMFSLPMWSEHFKQLVAYSL